MARQKKPDQKPKFFLKDILFNREKIEKIAHEIAGSYEDFDTTSFVRETVHDFPNLELKQRMVHATTVLSQYLPHDYIQASTILVRSLPAELDPTKTDGDYGDFVYSIYSHYIAQRGIADEYKEHSFQMLESITRRFSAEFALRHFFQSYPDDTLRQCITWSLSDNYHVRRLASEGSRPRLPWGIAIPIHYTQTRDILDNLFSDTTRYVTRSVANHLNDISKQNPHYIMEILKSWREKGTQNDREIGFIERHATRTIRKQDKIL